DRRTELRLHRLPRQIGQSLDPRAVAGGAEGPVRSFPDLAHQPANDLGHPPALPMVPGQYPRRRAAAGRQGIRRSGALSGVAECGAKAERAGDQTLGRGLTSVRAKGSLDTPLNARFWTKADKGQFLLRDGLFAFDPKRSYWTTCSGAGLHTPSPISICSVECPIPTL